MLDGFSPSSVGMRRIDSRRLLGRSGYKLAQLVFSCSWLCRLPGPISLQEANDNPGRQPNVMLQKGTHDYHAHSSVSALPRFYDRVIVISPPTKVTHHPDSA